MFKAQIFTEVVQRMRRKTSFDVSHFDQLSEQTMLFNNLQKHPQALLKQYFDNPFFKVKMDILCQNVSSASDESIEDDINLIAYRQKQIPEQEFITKNLIIMRSKHQYDALKNFKMLVCQQKSLKEYTSKEA